MGVRIAFRDGVFLAACLFGGCAAWGIAWSDPGESETKSGHPAVVEKSKSNSETQKSEKPQEAVETKRPENDSAKPTTVTGKQSPEKLPHAKSPAGKPSPEKKSAEHNSPEKGTAEESAAKVKHKNGDKNILKAGEFTAAHEAKALEFASQQHPELVDLITSLKNSAPKEYQRAIRELFRTSERLNGIRLREPARYDLELEAWKLQSHVRLLAARLLMASDPELESQLRTTLRQKAENRVHLLQFEKESLKSRLEQIDRDLEKAAKSVDQTVDQEFERMLKRSKSDKPVVQKPKKTKPTP